jgi:hypothetical protein
MSYIKYPETVEFYKKRNTLQVKLKKPVADDAGKIADRGEGCLFFEVANAIPGDADGRIDWNTKIVMKIGMNDIAKLLAFKAQEGEECKLFHKTAAGSSTLSLKLGTNPGTYSFNIGKVVGDQKSYVNVYLSAEDMTVLRELLRAALPTILGWN